LAVAEALKADDPSVNLRYVGSPESVERDLVARHGLDFRAVPSGPLHGINPFRAARSLFRIARGVGVALGVMRDFQPDAMLITGGWVTFPVAVAGWLRRVPILVFLPDIEPGATIRAISRLSTRVAVAIPDSAGYFRPGLAVHTGYPVRPELADALGRRDEGIKHFGLDPSLLTVLVFGGSHGARSINQALTSVLPELLTNCQVIHISGTVDWPWVSEMGRDLPENIAGRYHPRAYLHEDMGLALAAADLVVSRAGAGTLGEFPLFGLPAIVVPYPHAWRYQKVNADYLTERGAALRLDDASLADELLPTVQTLLADDEARQSMARSALALAAPDAARRVVAELQTLARESRGNL
jgi:UDP-N-acetylglucosamine--N-acetylmuramyl-(pentapeptide) pyrophosphoryl-undecaprenol N-acetylglucosamine transferase